MKRQAEELFEFAPASPEPIQKSPVKLLNTVTSSRIKKRREDTLISNGSSPEPGASPNPEDHQRIDEVKESDPVTNLNIIANEIEPTKAGPAPSPVSHRPFPCIWLNGNGMQEPNPKLPVAEVPHPTPHLMMRPGDINSVSPTHPMQGTEPSNCEPPIATTVVPPPIEPENVSVEVCPECHKVFKRKVYLQRHMEREHWSTAKVFKCDDCSYETKHQSNLSVHRRIHTGERPYHCGACGQRYTQGHLLKSHIRSRHGGNMEFYNLDKKSDSTRGRKSLDMKHDPTQLPTHKHTDKINQLVQQIEQQRKMSGLLPPTMSQFMSSMSPYISTLRPLMAPPITLTGSLMGPRLFTISSFQNALPGNTMLPLPMLGHAPIHVTSSNRETGIKIPLKIPEVPNPSAAYHDRSPSPQPKISLLSLPPPNPQTPPKPLLTALELEESFPQDLTTKKHHHIPSINEVNMSGPIIREIHDVPANHEVPVNREVNHHFQNGYHHSYDSSPMSQSNLSSSSPSDEEVPEELTIKKVPLEDIQKPVPDPVLDHVQDLRKIRDLCMDGDCDHAQKLRSLRRNIVRMLSVLTPDLSIENGLDYNSDQVDQMLYEVIYSNIDETGPDKKT